MTAFRRVGVEDYPGMLALQEANLVENLPMEQHKDGFLSARFAADQFARMNREAAVVVAEDLGRIVGYACTAGVDFSRQFPILDTMIATFGRLTYLGTTLIDARVCIYGPVCVDRAWRGRGVLRGLIARMKEELAGQFDMAAAFISKANSRSLAAHVDGLGMTVLGDYAFAAGLYWIVAFAISPSDLACGVGPGQYR
jgi:hypothetical protein